ncbi:hypothetical protein KQX54_009658 [Cotesia glomerata]|uniref:Uncharacterized protein n=1 Tax=Cotesia glomerata TaxID=32391 RepID=A0AAV7J0E4_COTGL|nr:hypothetical protein KQX54_009658 [Cotesia glomerata]
MSYFYPRHSAEGFFREKFSSEVKKCSLAGNYPLAGLISELIARMMPNSFRIVDSIHVDLNDWTPSFLVHCSELYIHSSVLAVLILAYNIVGASGEEENTPLCDMLSDNRMFYAVCCMLCITNDPKMHRLHLDFTPC